ncbi:MAG: outer membrane beta-barrel protein [Massilibacteroides sp.]|nr:outer membrane beta-barrel protein [Massilibacteroides sp.]MDD3063554.1 outer membrane beta-barrel protein [Massilibacteroides sp.]MDD4661492.1 outer membrane beta-barrel protein [Massilibacteroides sp.]
MYSKRRQRSLIFIKRSKEQLSLFLFLILNLQVTAQNSFSGVVTDVDNETLPGVQVLLFVGDSLYAGGLTDNSGQFSLQNLQSGEYMLHILYPGFTPLEEKRQIKGTLKYQFILMKEMTAELDGVEVVGNRSDIVKRTATGEIFYLSEKAKNSNDPYRALNEIPRLVANDALRTISMEDGTSPLILINGTTVHTGVTPIDPKDIESVEVMNVVSARYLRTGARHIINIKLKQKKNPYTFFEVMNRHDIPWRQGMGAVYFEIGNSKYSLYGRGSGNYIYDDDIDMDSWQQGTYYYKQSSGSSQTNNHYLLGELLFKWKFTEKDYLAAHVYGKYNKEKTNGSGDGLYETDKKSPFEYTSRNRNSSYVWTGSIYHQHLFTADQVLETTLAFNSNRNINEGERGETYPDWLYQYLYEYRNKRSSGSLNLDYSKNWNEIHSLNIGSETKYVNDHIHQVSDNFPVFHHRQWNQYLYASFSSKVGNLYYMGSLGVEGIWLKAGNITSHYFKPRGSFSGTYVVNEQNSFQTSYTLLNEAPSVGQLNPYNTSTDSLVINKGNPYLLPMQKHDFNASYTFNKAGLYITPSVGYSIYTDIIEPFGYSEDDIYISTYHNAGKFKMFWAGASVNYRLGNFGNIYVGGNHLVNYYPGQSPRKTFICNGGMSGAYKKWYFNMNLSYQEFIYTAVSRTKYYTPNYSSIQLNYNFTPNFYVAVAVQYFTGALHTETETHSENYQAFLSQRMLDLNVRPWVLIRYTLRKNNKQKIKLKNVVTGKEQGISL